MSTRIFTIVSLTLLCIFAAADNAMCFWALPRFAGLVVTSDVLVVAWNSNLYSSARIAAFDTKTGKLRWQQTKPNVDARDPLVVSGTMLFASTLFNGVYVRDVRTGVLKAHLQPECPGPDNIAYAPRVVLVAYSNAKWTLHLEAFDTSGYHSMWKRDIPRSTVWDMTSSDGTFKLLITQPWSREMFIYPDPRKPETIILSVQDGKVISRKPDKQPEKWDSNLPKSIRQWFQKKSAPHPRTEFEHIDDCWFFGSWEDDMYCLSSGSYDASRLFTVWRDNAGIVWKRRIPEITAIRLYRGILYVAAFETYAYNTGKNRSRVLAVEPQTGRVLWSRYVDD